MRTDLHKDFGGVAPKSEAGLKKKSGPTTFSVTEISNETKVDKNFQQNQSECIYVAHKSPTRFEILQFNDTNMSFFLLVINFSEVSLASKC